ncbi:hypothetical protein D3C87_1909590 [compost metagenome]
MVENQTNISGPKILPTTDVPKRWIANNKVIIVTTIGIVGRPGYLMSNPSIAEEMVMAGVIIPSARRVAAPIIAGKINQGALLRTNEKRERIPPSPLLSA